jgi:hypothetical protein
LRGIVTSSGLRVVSVPGLGFGLGFGDGDGSSSPHATIAIAKKHKKRSFFIISIIDLKRGHRPLT